MGVDDTDQPAPEAKAVSTFDRVLGWILCAPGLLVILYGTYLAGVAFFVLMPGGRPTSASLTGGAGLVLMFAGLLIFGVGWLLGRSMRRG